jgi:glycerol-3-phosphate acyltransferase PlsY
MSPWLAILAVVAAYLLGSVSFAWLLAWKLRGVDLRTVGSGNLGATNAGRLLGRKLAILVYFLDFSKGLLPVLLLRLFAGGAALWDAVPVALAAGVAAFVGHCFPLWHGFRGGKGVATASGAIVGLTPLVALVAFAVFGLTLRQSRIVSLASLSAAATLPVAEALIREGERPGATLVGYAAMALIVAARHHRNVRRLIAGEEPRIGGAAR